MTDEQYTFTQARARLEEIVTQVRRKDVSLEKSLDLLEEGVRLANACTEAIDHTEWRAVAAEQEEGDSPVTVAAVQDAAEPSANDEVTPEEPHAETVVAEIVEAEVVESITDDGVSVMAAVADVEFMADADDAWPDEVEPEAGHTDT